MLRCSGSAGRCFGKGQLHEAVGQGCGLQTDATHEQGSALRRSGFSHYVSVLPVNGEFCCEQARFLEALCHI